VPATDPRIGRTTTPTVRATATLAQEQERLPCPFNVTATVPRRIHDMQATIPWGVSLATSRDMNGCTDPLARLMARYAAGDDGVFDAIYQCLEAPLYRFCLRLTAQRHEADDLFQETFLKMHRARATYAPGANVLHWSYAIARSLYLSRVRYWQRRPEWLGPAKDVSELEDTHNDVASTPEAELIADRLLDVVVAELRRMSEKNRSAYVLMRQEGFSAADAAAVLGTTVDSVKQRAHRADQRIRSALSDAGWTGDVYGTL
jgi:RNA polymerase sigma-70 factor (ECF subfamily)